MIPKNSTANSNVARSKNLSVPLLFAVANRESLSEPVITDDKPSVRPPCMRIKPMRIHDTNNKIILIAINYLLKPTSGIFVFNLNGFDGIQCFQYNTYTYNQTCTAKCCCACNCCELCKYIWKHS